MEPRLPGLLRLSSPVAVAAGTWLLIDLWRVWTPSLITIFGQAAETPAELMGLYALGVMAVPVLLLLVLRRAGGGQALVGLVLLALACRVALMLTDGGRPQLYVASAGVALAATWLCLGAQRFGRALVPGLFAGVALSAVTHAGLGTWGAVWRADAWGWLVLLLQVLLVMATLGVTRSTGVDPVSRRTAWLVFPALLLCGIALANMGRSSAADGAPGLMAVALAAVAAVVVASLRLGSRARWAAGAVLVFSVVVLMVVTASRDNAPGQQPGWAWIAYLVGLPALAGCLTGGGAGDSGRPWRAPRAAAGGALLWVVALFGFYAGYDLGWRADWLIVVIAAVVAVLGATSPTAPGLAAPQRWTATAGVAVLAVVVAGLGSSVTLRPTGNAAETTSELRVMAWNLRMGYGMDGRFQPALVARAIRAQRPDVVLLSEIDRGWLLNGGQDQLRVLEGLTGMRAIFGAAADQVWGDAIMTRLPISDVRGHPLESFGAVTGAQALAATVRWQGRDIRVVSTHLQGAADFGTLKQAKVLADLMAAERTHALPVVVGGDLNTAPTDKVWQALVEEYDDALSSGRPLNTSPADRPQDQIDHILTHGMRTSGPKAPRNELSDHLAVVVDLAPTS